MAFHGYLTIDGTEFANSSRVVSHLGGDIPDSDVGMFTPPAGPQLVEDPPGSGLYLPDAQEMSPGLYDPSGLTESSDDQLYLIPPPVGGECGLVEVEEGLFAVPASSIRQGEFYTPPDGSRRFDTGLIAVGDECWEPVTHCDGCRTHVEYDDSWPGLAEFVGDGKYRLELAPWYVKRLPESAEFTGVWMLSIDGLDVTPSSRPITELVGSGASAGPHRDGARVVKFDALLIGCTNAGLDYGLKWLACLLRDTNDRTDAVLGFLNAHPSWTKAPPSSLMREAHGLVLTSGPTIQDRITVSSRAHQQATMYRVQWEMTLLSPYVYLPKVELTVDWDQITSQPIEWVHAADCAEPEFCQAMPVLFSTDCVPETIDIISSPPPSCGGCMPVANIESFIYRVPTMDYAFRCRETAVTLEVKNTGRTPLTVQSHWRVCGTSILCEDNRFPLQISGLEPGATVHLDGISGRYWADYQGRRHKTRGIVSTPTGAPWRPPLIDRGGCWEFVVTAPADADFDVSMVLADREA